MLQLESQLEAGRVAVTLRGLVAAIKAICLGRSALSDTDTALISWFLRGAQIICQGPHSPRDLDLVLHALQRPSLRASGKSRVEVAAAQDRLSSSPEKLVSSAVGPW